MKIIVKDHALNESVIPSLNDQNYPRKELSEILIKYNQSIGNAVENAEKLAQNDSRCIITGQQLGLFGGPSYTILKAISCLLIAREVNAIPIFWLATEDHDVDEISNTYLLDKKGNLEKFHLRFPRNRLFVEDLTLTPSALKEIERFEETVGIHIKSQETSYCKRMVKYLVKLFEGTGLIFVEPYLLRQLARPIFSKEITEGTENNIFIKRDGKYRTKVMLDESTPYAKDELLRLLEEHPEMFSANVSLRTIVQSSLFPTQAYVAGPNEMKYYGQLEGLHRFHNVQMPFLIPRISATLIPSYARDMLHAEPWEEIPQGKEGHLLNNLLQPQGKLQERVLNWWTFQSSTSENLIQEFLKAISWREQGHHYCYLT
jgi:uncharacterized protein YllA (UPF0747 family)